MASPERSRGTAFARAALAGNPSDAYGGAVLAIAFGELSAEVSAQPATRLSVDPASALVEAAVGRFARELEPAGRSSALQWSTSIPRAVGLGGSSAIVIATLRALCDLHGVSLGRAELAALALAVETEDLGIAAGPQDRVAQAYGGLTFMDFGDRGGGDRGFGDCGGRYEQLDAGLLPSLLIAWSAGAAADSGTVHGDLHARFERGEPAVVASIAELGSLARRARAALLARDREELARCVDASFDARTRMMDLDPAHVELIARARACGASANYTGSGGAIVTLCRDDRQRQAVCEALSAAGCEMLVIDSRAERTGPGGALANPEERTGPGGALANP